MVQGVGCKVTRFDPFLVEFGHEGVGRVDRPQVPLFQRYFGEEETPGDADIRLLGGMRIPLRLELVVVLQGRLYGFGKGEPRFRAIPGSAVAARSEKSRKTRAIAQGCFLPVFVPILSMVPPD